jgi:hypothetical protein
MAEPPLLLGIVKFTVNAVLFGATLVILGALGTVYGCAENPAEAVPAPTTFTALIFTEYTVLLISPVMTMGLAEAAGDLVVHVVPPLVEY